MKNSENIWEEIHSKKEWGKYPNEELVRCIGKKFFYLPKERRGNIKILEIGSGQGANLWFLAKNGFDTYGIDISESAIEKAKKFLPEEYGVAANLAVADAIELPFDGGIFDAVIDCATVQHLSYKDHKKAYAEIYRTLKHGGLFWSFHVSDKSWGYDAEKPQNDYKTFNKLSEGFLADVGVICMLSDADVRFLLEKEGFVNIRIERNIRTYENQKREIVHWGVQAEKPKTL